MDIFQNSIESGASLVELDIVEDSAKNMLTLMIRDNGRGITQQAAEMATDPFFTTRTTRKVGLGLPLLKQNAERTGSYFYIESAEGVGTTVSAGFVLNSIDRPVLGDVAGVFMLTATASAEVHFIYRHRKNHKSCTFDTREFGSVLGEIPLNEPMVYRPICDLINNNLHEIGIETEV